MVKIPAPLEWSHRWRIVSHFFWPFVSGGCLLLAFVAALYWYFGSLQLAAAYVRGERIVVLPYEVNLGECDSETLHDAVFTIRNLTGGTLRLVGSEQDCNCVTLDEAAQWIGPHESHTMALRVRVAGSQEFVHRILLYFDDGELTTRVVQVRARAKPVPMDGNGGAPRSR